MELKQATFLSTPTSNGRGRTGLTSATMQNAVKISYTNFRLTFVLTEMSFAISLISHTANSHRLLTTRATVRETTRREKTMWKQECLHIGNFQSF